jgi:hypothetical protein
VEQIIRRLKEAKRAKINEEEGKEEVRIDQQKADVVS